MVGSAGGGGSGVTCGDVGSTAAVGAGMVRDATGDPPPHPLSTRLMVTSNPIAAERTWEPRRRISPPCPSQPRSTQPHLTITDRTRTVVAVVRFQYRHEHGTAVGLVNACGVA